MIKLTESIKEKDNCLTGWKKEHTTGLSDLYLRWDHLNKLIDDQQGLVQERIKHVKSDVEIEVNQLLDEVDNSSVDLENILKDFEQVSCEE